MAANAEPTVAEASPTATAPASPRGALMLVLAISAAVGVSAAAGAVSALAQPRASWVMFGFEVVVLVAGVLGVLIGRGKLRDGPALGAVCVAMTVLIGSVFGYLGGGRVLFGMDVRMLLYVRAIAALVIGAGAAWIVLSRDMKSTFPLFIRGVAFGVPVPVLGVVLWKARTQFGALPDVAQLGLSIVIFGVLTGLMAASVHLLIKAFDIGVRKAEGA